MACEICGKKILGLSNRIIIDGAKLIVCSKCACFSSSSWNIKKKSQLAMKNVSSKSSIRRSKPMHGSVDEEFELVEDYGQRIRKAREKMNLSQKDLGKTIQEKASVLQKLEIGKMVPDDKLTKKLEKSLKINLLAPPSSLIITKDLLIQKPFDLTLGDVVRFKKKGTSSEAEVSRE